MLLTFENLSRILQLETASKPQNLRAEPQKLERVTPRSSELYLWNCGTKRCRRLLDTGIVETGTAVLLNTNLAAVRRCANCRKLIAHQPC